MTLVPVNYNTIVQGKGALTTVNGEVLETWICFSHLERILLCKYIVLSPLRAIKLNLAKLQESQHNKQTITLSPSFVEC